MPEVKRYRKGDVLAALKLNESVDELNKLIAPSNAPKQKSAPAEEDAVAQGETTEWNEVSRILTVIRAIDATLTTQAEIDEAFANGPYVDIERVEQVIFTDGQGNLQVFNYVNKAPNGTDAKVQSGPLSRLIDGTETVL